MPHTGVAIYQKRIHYSKPVRPTDILVKHSVSNPKSADLRNAAAKLIPLQQKSLLFRHIQEEVGLANRAFLTWVESLIKDRCIN